MDIELLKTFLEVRRTRHFGRAAENLYLTQAAVSARIKLLEGHLGVPLFTRYRNNLQLTTAGERLINHAESILNSWDRARADVALKKEHSQVLSLGATSGLWDLILQDALSDIHHTIPTVALRAESHGQDVLIRRLMERTLDLAIVYEPAKMSELVSLQVTEAQLILVSTRADLAAESAIAKNFVSVDWGTAFEINFAEAFQNLSSPILHTTQAKIALEFILTHGGSAYLPMRMVKPLLATQLFQVDGAPLFNRPIFVSYHQDNRNTPLIDKILSIFEKQDPTD